MAHVSKKNRGVTISMLVATAVAMLAACTTPDSNSGMKNDSSVRAGTKNQWAIGKGENRRVWDHEPTEEEVRQWRYETIRDTAGQKKADEWLMNQLRLDAMKSRAERERLELNRLRQQNASGN